MLMAAVWLGRGWEIWGLPDVERVADVAAFGTVDLPAEKNAYIRYQQAARVITAYPRLGGERLDFKTEWSQAHPKVRAWVDSNDEALDLWRQGTELPDALYHQPKNVRFDTVLPVVDRLRQLIWMAGLRGSSLEENGEMADAWPWYRAMLRCSRHVGMHGGIVERLVGWVSHRDTCQRINHWAADPRTDALLLRRALDEAIAIEAMTVPNSATLKADYMMIMAEIEHPDRVDRLVLMAKPPSSPGKGWMSVVGNRLVHETARLRMAVRIDPKRSRRVTRLLFANWLAQCDRPPHLRPRVARLSPLIFEPDAATPPTARALSPQELARWYESTTLAKAVLGDMATELSPAKFIQKLDEERAERASLIVTLAEQLFLRQRGRLPRSAEELVGTTLKKLPEGYASKSAEPGPAGVGKPLR
jgi:hypothetical protein